MKRRWPKILLRSILVLLGLALVYLLVNTVFIARDYFYGPEMLFLKSRYLSVDIYPRGHQSAAVFTNNYIEGTSTVEDIDILRLFLKKRDIRGVFFVIPNYLGLHPLDESEQVVEELRKLAADGHEIAQAGTFHTLPEDREAGGPPGRELAGLNFEERLERVRKGGDLLAGLGFPPSGFRAPDFEIDRDTFRVLETAEYLYSSSSLIPPRTLGTVLRPPLTAGVLYPYHPFGFDLLEFTGSLDPTRDYNKSLRLFRRVHDLQGVFVFHTYIGNIARRENIKTLDRFLETLREKNTWFATLEEISRWWLAREKLRVETQNEGDLFTVIMTNRSRYPLDELGVRFLKHPFGARRFIVRDGRGEILAEGFLPRREKLFVTVPPSPPAAP